MTDDEVRAALSEQGFLAPVVRQDFPARYRQMASSWFEMAENISGIGQTVAMRAIQQGHGQADPRAYGTALLLRTLQSYQAAILLCSMGLAADARMLIRACFETAFCIAALVDDPVKLIRALEDDDNAAKRALAKFIAADPARMVNLDPNARKRVQKFASTVDQHWGKVRQLAIDETAKSTELRDAYLLYRVLSNDSCHPSATSLSRHIDPLPGDRWDYKLGPEAADRVADTINIACQAIMSALVAFTQLANDIAGNREIAVAVAAYGRINDAIVAGQQTPPPP